MKHRVTVVLALLMGLVGCDKINEKVPFVASATNAVTGFFKKKPPAARPGTPPAVPADTAARVAAATPAESTAHAPAPVPAPVPKAKVQHVAAAVDEPWTPTDTGTVNPGMTRDQVVAVWGAPVTERKQGQWTYLYFRNGCEYSCGTFDVVFLDNDQVMDAVVRGPGHTYSGNSSSPAGRVPEKTPTNLTVPAQQTTPQDQPVAPAPSPAPGTAA